MTTTKITVASPAAAGSNPAVGRNIYVEGNRYVGRFQITLPSQWTGAGVAFDPKTFGFPSPVVSVNFKARDVLSQQGRARYTVGYDYTNKKICVWDGTDSDTADGDDLSTLTFDVTVVGE